MSIAEAREEHPVVIKANLPEANPKKYSNLDLLKEA